MGGYNPPPDFVGQFRALQTRLAKLERRNGPPYYTTAGRPAASTVRGLIIFDTDLNKHYGSDGTTWQPLY